MNETVDGGDKSATTIRERSGGEDVGGRGQNRAPHHVDAYTVFLRVVEIVSIYSRSNVLRYSIYFAKKKTFCTTVHYHFLSCWEGIVCKI
jgi:hypothetical protein